MAQCLAHSWHFINELNERTQGYELTDSDLRLGPQAGPCPTLGLSVFCPADTMMTAPGCREALRGERM